MSNHKPILMPVLRNVDPKTVAQDIIGVQPMTGPVGSIFTLNTKYDPMKFERIQINGLEIPDGYCAVQVTLVVAMWIEEQPIDQWKPINDVGGWRYAYTISNELYTAMALKWA